MREREAIQHSVCSKYSRENQPSQIISNNFRVMHFRSLDEKGDGRMWIPLIQNPCLCRRGLLGLFEACLGKRWICLGLFKLGVYSFILSFDSRVVVRGMDWG